MRKFSFEEHKELLIPTGKNFVPFKDKNGKELDGDKLLLTMNNIIQTWETKYKRPVPIQNQKFIAWVKQAAAMLKQGKSSQEIFSQTLVQI